ncbi:electron transport complex subunit RsxE [Myxococcota bacterium]|nr:electron transport complex subunit RsxE [Myxococcota bacterium]MBU1432784.1 electron transport complex subunit RsxE [Myxococcota bacterium]MBU1897169.1 electron transport complex subunit RsxE [Myxococcota bacterium]
MASSGPTATERFINGIIPENPVYRQLLGMCPVLAVTNGLKPAMTMAAATGFVLISANIITSLIRNLLKPHLRILVFTLTIATFVTIADKILAAYLYEMSKALGPYIPLIIVNCLIISRCEICASKQDVKVAFFDGLGMSLGFALALASIATVRELLGSGSLFGVELLAPTTWPRWGILVLPPGAFLTLGVLLGVAEWWGQRKKAKEA